MQKDKRDIQVNRLEIWAWLILALLLTAFSSLLYFRIAPHFFENPGISFARQAHSISILVDQALAENASFPDWLSEIRADYGLLQLLFLLPGALVYSWLGVSDVGSLLFPFGYHLGAALALYFLARRITRSNRAAFITVFLWAILPATTFNSSASPLTAAFLLLSIVGVYSLLRFTGERSWPFLLMSLGALVLTMLLWPGLAVAQLAFGLIAFYSPTRSGSWLVAKVSLALGTAVILLVPNSGNQFRALLGNLFESPGFLVVLLLFFLVYSAYANGFLPKLEPLGNLGLYSLLTVAAYVYLPPPQDLFAENIGGFPVLAVLVPVVLLIGYGFSHWLAAKPLIWTSGIALSFGILFALTANLDFSLILDRFSADFYISVSRISSGILVLGILLYLLLRIISDHEPEAQFSTFVLLLLPIAAIFPLAAANYANASHNSSFARASRLAEAISVNEKELDIFVCSRQLRDRLWYMTGFSNFGEQNETANRNPFQKPPTDISNRDGGLAIIDSACDEINPTLFDSWNHMFGFGEKDSRLEIYRILPKEE